MVSPDYETSGLELTLFQVLSCLQATSYLIFSDVIFDILAWYVVIIAGLALTNPNYQLFTLHLSIYCKLKFILPYLSVIPVESCVTQVSQLIFNLLEANCPLDESMDSGTIETLRFYHSESSRDTEVDR